MNDETVELVLDAKATLGEGAIWHGATQRLYWVDIFNNALHVYDPATGRDEAINVGQAVGTVVPRRQGGLALALHHGFATFDLKTRQLTMVVDPESHLSGNRFNDGKCDPAGRFWAGTMAYHGEPPESGSLYCLFADHTVRRMLENVSCSNGIVWSGDRRTMYYIDTPRFTVDAFDYDPATGAIRNRRVAITIPRPMGSPDGSTLDADDMLWVAHFGGGSVSRWNPRTGKLLQTVKLPVANVTSCAFGGPRLDDLYITTARLGLTESALAQQPQAGGLFRARVGVTGVPAFEYAG